MFQRILFLVCTSSWLQKKTRKGEEEFQTQYIYLFIENLMYNLSKNKKKYIENI